MDAQFKLKLPQLGLRIKRLDADGNVISDRRESAHSWTRNGWNMLFGLMTGCIGDEGVAFGAGYMSGKQIDGTIDSDGYVSRTSRTNTYGFMNNVSAGSATHATRGGLVVGSGNTAFNIDDFELDTIIESGADAGELWYPAYSYWSADYDALSNTWTATHTRSILNDSGGDVTVREAGLHWYARLYKTGTGADTYLVARDVFEEEEVVAHSETLVIYYEIICPFGTMGNDGWTRNAFSWMFSSMSDATSTGENAFEDGVLTARNTAGTIHSAQSSSLPYGSDAHTVLGSGATAFTVDDYNVETEIADGSSAGQLTRATTSRTPSYASKTWKATISRVFTNNSGGDVTVREIGYRRQVRIYTSLTGQNYLFLRKVLDSAEVVANTDTFTLNIEISMDYSEID